MDQPPAATLLTERVQSLARDGFLIVEDFLDACTVGNLIGAMEALPTDVQASRVRRGVAFARRNLLEFDFVGLLIADPRVQRLLTSIAPGLTAVRAILFDKSGGANWTVPWHQDRSIAVRERIEVPGFGPWSTKAGIIHVQPPLDILRQMLTLRFHLDPCGHGNGPLRVIAGTHTRIMNQKEVEESSATSEQTVCTTGSGGLLVMRPLLLHASAPAIKPFHRRVIHVEFGPPNLSGDLQWAATRQRPA